jgi:biopolymer transport protein ExbB
MANLSIFSASLVESFRIPPPMGMALHRVLAVAGGGTGGYQGNPLTLAADYAILAVLTAGSVACIALIISALLNLREEKIAPSATTDRLRSLIESRRFKELMDWAATDESFVSKALYAGVRRAHLGYTAMREGLENAAAEQSSNLFRRIEMLNVIGNVAPLIGLLGTVLGMIMAFYALHQTGGQPKVTALSLGIATALWNTFFGLAIAIPSLVAFGYFRIRLDKIVTRASLLADEFLESLRPGPSRAPGGAPAGTGEPEAPSRPAAALPA